MAGHSAACKDPFESVYLSPGWEVATPVRVCILDFVLNNFFQAKRQCVFALCFQRFYCG
jgi:hypothetical protein